MMPPSPRGSVQEQLVRQYSYLFQMAQQLNVALGQLESGGTAAPSGGTAAPAAEREQQYQTLKSMIVKTADTCLLYTSPSPRDSTSSRMPSSA